MISFFLGLPNPFLALPFFQGMVCYAVTNSPSNSLLTKEGGKLVETETHIALYHTALLKSDEFFRGKAEPIAVNFGVVFANERSAGFDTAISAA
jgi:hypothetical protein